MLPETNLPPLAKPLSFAEVAELPQFRGMNRGQVGRHLLALDKELGGALLSKTARAGGKTSYRVTRANLRKLVPSLFEGEAPPAPEPAGAELEERVRVLEEAVERQARKLGELATAVRGIAHQARKF
jgi:hypothetical protein